jgi:fructose-1,6-bisphosphatase/inositol monophosphatase family enzyme/ADP-ribosylglycohydrolase
LAIAVRVARIAGQRIRSEFYRAGGPRGAHSKAPIDAEVEQLIRHELALALPSAAFIGEESSGEVEVLQASRACWLVDPHDGTSSFLEGWRGSTVCIGLVMQGVPVLGVVHAPLAPDDQGELWSWCEGMPLLRNGAPVQRASWPSELGPAVTVAVSQHADRAAGANVGVLKGARFRSVPSVAYRLALAASGDADAVVSLAGVTWWDIAAGHALLRAVGGEVLDDRGRPVRYEGRRAVFDCFAGSPTLAKTLAELDWSQVRQRPPRDEFALRYPRVWPSHRAHVRNPEQLARAQGCWLGQLAGDSLGSRVEFMDAATIAQKHPTGVRDLVDGGVWNTLAGQPTDDSEMALILARTLITQQRYDSKTVFRAYQDWLHSNPFDLGNTTRSALVGQPLASSQANGALMRCSPLALWDLSLTDEQRAAMARADAALTHPHPLCQDVNAVFVLTLCACVRDGLSPIEAHQYALGAAHAMAVDAAVIERLEAASSANVEHFSIKEGWVLIALQNAFYQLLHSTNARDAVIDTVMRGGDTDTNAAIAGALTGAVFARDSLDPAWVNAVLSCRAQHGVVSVKRPRPSPFWPADALELAERLLCGPIEASATSAP